MTRAIKKHQLDLHKELVVTDRSRFIYSMTCLLYQAKMEEDFNYNEKPDINIVRKVYDELHLATTHRRSSQFTESSDSKSCFQNVYTKLASCSCSWQGFSQFVFRLAPILQWLPKYSVKNDLLADVTGGVTVGIMHIPQGKIL